MFLNKSRTIKLLSLNTLGICLLACSSQKQSEVATNSNIDRAPASAVTETAGLLRSLVEEGSEKLVAQLMASKNIDRAAASKLAEDIRLGLQSLDHTQMNELGLGTIVGKAKLTGDDVATLERVLGRGVEGLLERLAERNTEATTHFTQSVEALAAATRGGVDHSLANFRGAEKVSARTKTTRVEAQFRNQISLLVASNKVSAETVNSILTGVSPATWKKDGAEMVLGAILDIVKYSEKNVDKDSVLRALNGREGFDEQGLRGLRLAYAEATALRAADATLSERAAFKKGLMKIGVANEEEAEKMTSCGLFSFLKG